MGRTLQDLVARGMRLKKRGLVDGFEAFQDWRDDCLTFIADLQCQFASEVENPLHIDRGIEFLEMNFVRDE